MSNYSIEHTIKEESKNSVAVIVTKTTTAIVVIVAIKGFRACAVVPVIVRALFDI